MKFLLDVNASAAVQRWLENHGHDVVLVASKDARMNDSTILDWAGSEGRVIVTTDKDFEEMIWRERRRHKGILRLENVPRSQRLRLLQDAIESHSTDLESGSIVIALRKGFRIRTPLIS